MLKGKLKPEFIEKMKVRESESTIKIYNFKKYFRVNKNNPNLLKMKRALFIGRFQPFHKGHLHVAKNLSKEFDDVIIGIGSSQEKNTKNNPFSYNERESMISKTLRNNKIKNFKIYPIPDLYDDYKWTGYILKNLPKFDVVYSGNEWTLKCFRKHKIKAKKIRLVKGISSTKIRGMMGKNENWGRLVPEEGAKYIKQIKGAERIKKVSR